MCNCDRQGQIVLHKAQNLQIELYLLILPMYESAYFSTVLPVECLSNVFICGNMICEKWYLSLVLLCNHFVNSRCKNRYLRVICILFSVSYLFLFFAYFPIEMFVVFLLIYMSLIYTYIHIYGQNQVYSCENTKHRVYFCSSHRNCISFCVNNYFSPTLYIKSTQKSKSQPFTGTLASVKDK